MSIINDTEDWVVADTVTFLGVNGDSTKEHIIRNAVKRGIAIGRRETNQPASPSEPT